MTTQDKPYVLMFVATVPAIADMPDTQNHRAIEVAQSSSHRRPHRETFSQNLGKWKENPAVY